MRVEGTTTSVHGDLKPHWSQSVAPIVGAITALAAIGALVFTSQQVRLTQQGQITDRFAKAVEQLGQAGPQKAGVRLGAVYLLERIMRDSRDDQPTVVDVLAVFVRLHAVPPTPKPSTSRSPKPDPSEPPRAEPPADIQAAITVLGRRDVTADRKGSHIDLRGAHLAGAWLADADLADADLTDSNLTGAVLDRADLSRTHLRGAFLGGAYLDHADLTDAYLDDAHLTRTQLHEAVLTNASLDRADLTKTYLAGANLADARLVGADLSGANLDHANLDHTNLHGANLTDVNMEDARNLTTQQLRCSTITASTQLPVGVPRPAPEPLESLYCE